jgi:hypothetical protein
MLVVAASGQVTGQYISFDAPNAGTGINQGTYPNAINGHGWIGGTVVYSTGASHGFLRQQSGSFIAVDAPGAAQTWVSAINASNESVGYYFGATCTCGFFRDAAGTYTEFSYTGADTTSPSGVNSNGLVSGYEHDGTGYHGFLWSASRGFTVFDVPGSVPGSTLVFAINDAGAVTGTYVDSSYYSHVYIRSANGHFTTFEPVYGGTHSNAAAINTSGEITGWGDDGMGDTYGFIANAHRADEVFAVAGSPGTDGTAINDSGVVVGYGFSDAGGNFSFERETDGTINVLSLPFSNTANQPTGINRLGDVVGYYTDSAGANHGWVGVP